MTRRANVRLAGVALLIYFAAGIANLVLSGRAISGEGVAGKLASIARHTTDMRVMVLLTLVTTLSAWVLAVTLYSITREQDPDLAMLGMICRVGEGLNGGASIGRMLSLLWIATVAGANAPDAAGSDALGAFLLRGTMVSATFFAVGSTLFCWLLLRGRMIPVPLAWLGVVASVLLVVVVPLDLVGFIRGPATQLAWVPMAAFEIPLAFWLIIKGVAPVQPASSNSFTMARGPSAVAVD